MVVSQSREYPTFLLPEKAPNLGTQTILRHRIRWKRCLLEVLLQLVAQQSAFQNQIVVHIPLVWKLKNGGAGISLCITILVLF